MLDREKVIEILESCVASPLRRKGDKFVISFDVRFANAIIDLLKEQPEIIRCKDCKHRPQIPDGETYGDGFDLKFPEGSKCPCQCLYDGYYSWYPEDNWFCANGEPKEGVNEQKIVQA